MTSPVNKAMMESYALMVLVMGTFFIYFCGMVWAFSNPKLSGSEEEEVCEAAELHGNDCLERRLRCACSAHLELPAPPYTKEELTQTTYVNFWDDTYSLLSDCTALTGEDHGVYNHCHSSSGQDDKEVT